MTRIATGSDDERREQIRDEVFRIIADRISIDRKTLSEEKRFKEDLGFDSLDLVDSVITCENRFQISIPQDCAETFVKVGDVIEYVLKHTDERG